MLAKRALAMLALLGLLWVAFGLGQALAESITWGAALEASPTDSDLAANIDNFIRETRTAVRERGDTELSWDDTGGDTTQTGRLRPGAARPFYQDAAPTVLTVSDSDGSTDLDDGRLWFESDPESAAAVTTCCAKGYVRDQSASIAGAGAKFVQMIGVPTNGIILWAQATGDENCDGTMVADECPCGFVEDGTFGSLLVRGADTTNINGDVPNTPGITCALGAAGVGCGAPADTNYDDTLATVEMPAHTHNTVLDRENNDGAEAANAMFDTSTEDDALTQTTIASSSTGGGQVHLHPFRTVLFCRAR